MNPYVSSIYLFGGNFAIYGFQICAGQILPITSNTALFSLIGTYYGGNGTSNFALPDLRGRTAINQGQSPGNSDYVLGEQTGTETTTMLYANVPVHNHLANAIPQSGSSGTPAGNYFSEIVNGSGHHTTEELFYNTGPANTPLNPNSVATTGGSQPFNIQQPVLCITALIAMQGIFPARN
jgi:microcystin-dependent protein